MERVSCCKFRNWQVPAVDMNAPLFPDLWIHRPLPDEPLPNRFAYIMARGCRNRGRHIILCGGALFSPSRSISNSISWKLVEPTSSQIGSLKKSHKWCQKNICQECTTQNLTRMQMCRSRCPDVRISDIRYNVSGTRYQISGRHQKKQVNITNCFVRQLKKAFQRIGQIEVVAHRLRRNLSCLLLLAL